MHPQAYEVIYTKTSKRVYDYTGKNSISVRTLDGYQFPVDVRVSVKISAENAPYVVALLGDPDADANGDGFDVLEEKAILPSIRSILRNSAEGANGLEYVRERSTIETSSTEAFRKDMQKFKVEVDAVYVADIRLDDTEEGKALLLTQTDRELADQQAVTYDQQQLAQVKRADVIAATEAADRKKDIEAALALDVAAEHSANAAEKKADGASRAAVKVATGLAEAIRLEATAEAAAREMMAMADGKYNREMVESLGGVENYTQIKLMGQAFEAWQGGGNVPQISVSGGAGGGSLDVIMAQIIQRLAVQSAAAAK